MAKTLPSIFLNNINASFPCLSLSYLLPYHDNFSVTSISTSMFGDAPILSLKLDASLHLYNLSIISSFSFPAKHVLSKFIYFLISPYLSYIFSHLCHLTMDIFLLSPTLFPFYCIDQVIKLGTYFLC